MKRPPRAVRIGVLVMAVGCLGLTMCAHSHHASSPAGTTPTSSFAASKAPGGLYEPSEPESQQAPRQQPAPNQAPPQAVQARQAQPTAPADAATRDPEFFPATKAPAGLR